MNSPSPKSVALTVLAYIGVSFAVQAASHFGINAGHYRAISIMRADPIIPLGILSMVIQGLVFGLLVVVERRNPLIATAYSIGLTLFAYWLFGKALKAPLERGLLWF